MARFILDVANVNENDIEKILSEVLKRIGEEDINYGIAEITCIEDTNESQFYNDLELNVLTPRQIEFFNSI
jgi:hypothetical protein